MAFLVFAVGLVAGFVDAIAGGGGLIMLPGLLFAGLPVGSAIATNKLCGTFGALTSTLKFAHGKQIDWTVCAWMALPVVIGAYVGSRSIEQLPAAWAEPIVIALITAITAFIVLNPSFGVEEKEAEQSKQTAPDQINNQIETTANRAPFKRLFFSIIAGSIIGFHDGFFGPGTGIFLVFSLLWLWPMDFLKATGTTKLLNLLTNVTALITFAFSGSIVYSLGTYGAVGVAIGAYIGTTFATRKGAKFIRPIFIAVTTALVIRLAANYLSS